jgi:hypothetical protein
MSAKKLDALIDLLSRQWVTVQDSQKHCGLNSLAQRVSELRREGHIIADKWVKADGSRFKMYSTNEALFEAEHEGRA